MAEIDPKYIGDPESPNFLPSSPLIERQVIPHHLEAELRRFCQAVLGDEQSNDPDFTTMGTFMPAHSQPFVGPQRHDKNSSFSFQQLKPYAPEAAISNMRSAGKLPARLSIQRKPVPAKLSGPAYFDPVQATEKYGLGQSDKMACPDDKALHEIRTKMHSRPKTSAAACVDYSEPVSPLNSQPSPSVGSRCTTYSTPFSSAGITPENFSKSFSRSLINTVDFQEKQIQQISARSRVPHISSVISQNSTSNPYKRASDQSVAYSGQSARCSTNLTSNHIAGHQHSMSNFSASEIYRPPPRVESTRESVRCSYTSSSVPSGARWRLSARKSAVRPGSSGSRASSQHPGYEHENEYFVDTENFDLNRPLPPLPGLDSHEDKPKHISLQMNSISPPTDHGLQRETKQVIIDDEGLERTMTMEEENQRREGLARAVLEKMSTGSIGSVPTSPTGIVTVYRDGVCLNRNRDGTTSMTDNKGMGIDAVPLYRDASGPGRRPFDNDDAIINSHIIPTASAKYARVRPNAAGRLIKRWSSKFNLGIKPKPRTAPFV